MRTSRKWHFTEIKDLQKSCADDKEKLWNKSKIQIFYFFIYIMKQIQLVTQ